MGEGIIIHILGEWGWYMSCPRGRYKYLPGVGVGVCDISHVQGGGGGGDCYKSCPGGGGGGGG